MKHFIGLALRVVLSLCLSQRIVCAEPSPRTTQEPQADSAAEAAVESSPSATLNAEPPPQSQSVRAKAKVTARGSVRIQIGAKFSMHTWPASHHPPHTHGPTAHPVRFVHAFSDGGAALETESGQIVDADDGTVLIEAKPGRRYCAAGKHPNIACLSEYAIFNDKGERVAEQLWLHHSGSGSRVLSHVGPEGSLSALGIHVDQGPPSFLFTHYPGGKNAVTTTHWVSGGNDVVVDFSASGGGLRDLGSDRPNVAVRFVTFNGEPFAVYRDGDEVFGKTGAEIASNAAPRVISTERESVYEFRAVAGQDGWLYVFFHDPSSKSAHVATSRDGHSFKVRQLDTAETGTQMEAFADDRGVYVAYYYHVNQFDRGVRLYSAWNGEELHRSCTLVREEKHNVGWGVGLLLRARVACGSPTSIPSKKGSASACGPSKRCRRFKSSTVKTSSCSR